jgi:5-(carboxyamino)imidazole ribonucleotide synthase
MFLLPDGSLLGNEIAPRPHNSGHWTMDACAASQFEQHIRAVAGLPLADPTRHHDAVMRNLIGPEGMAAWPRLVATPGIVAHLYGKDSARPGRKMGHATRLLAPGSLAGRTDEETLEGL